MCVPKTRLSARRIIHPKFIFVRANIFLKKFFNKERETQKTDSRTILPSTEEREGGMSAAKERQERVQRPQPLNSQEFPAF